MLEPMSRNEGRVVSALWAWVAAATLASTMPVYAESESVYLPGPGHTYVSVGWYASTFDAYLVGRKRVENSSLGLGRATYVLGSAQVQYGLRARLAIDASTGYVRSEIRGLGSDQGLADSKVGLRWLLNDERTDLTSLPSLGLRIGAIIEGTYTPNRDYSAGKGASGAEASLLVGRHWEALGTTLSGDAGYRIRAEHVPDEIFVTVKIDQRILSWLGISLGYIRDQALSGPDTLTGAPYQRIREIHGSAFAAVNLDSGHDQYASIFVATTTDGANTGDSTSAGGSLTVGF